MSSGGRIPGRAFAAIAVLAACGCAPIAAYRGPAPAPGAVRAFAGGASPHGAPAPPRTVIRPGSTDPARHHLGDLVRESGDGPMVMLVLGDTRPGYRMEANSPAYFPVESMFSGGASGFFKGLLWSPVFLVTAILPTLDGPRDLVTVFTKRPQGGGESRVRRALESQLPADAVLHVGDIVFDGRRGRLWEDFVERTGSLRERVLQIAAPGNHERTYEPPAAAAYAAVMGEPADPGRFWFSLDVPASRARFVFLDSNVMTDVHANVDDALERTLCDAQLAWMDEALAGDQRLKLVVLHHPLISTGHYETDWGVAESAATAQRRTRMLEICARRGVTAVIAGHEHLYFRTRLRGSGGGSLWHLTSGGGGSPLYPIDRGRLEAQLARTLPAGWTLERNTAKFDRVYHYGRLELPTETEEPARWIAERVNGGGESTPFDTLMLGETR